MGKYEVQSSVRSSKVIIFCVCKAVGLAVAYFLSTQRVGFASSRDICFDYTFNQRMTVFRLEVAVLLLLCTTYYRLCSL